MNSCHLGYFGLVTEIVASVLAPDIMSPPAFNRAAWEQASKGVFPSAASPPHLPSSPSVLAQHLVPAAELLGLSPASLM